jgi:hypothetical protein
MSINAVADSVMLYLPHDFYNIIFKIKYKLYIASRSALPQKEKFWVHTCTWVTGFTVTDRHKGKNEKHFASEVTVIYDEHF